MNDNNGAGNILRKNIIPYEMASAASCNNHEKCVDKCAALVIRHFG